MVLVVGKEGALRAGVGGNCSSGMDGSEGGNCSSGMDGSEGGNCSSGMDGSETTTRRYPGRGRVYSIVGGAFRQEEAREKKRGGGGGLSRGLGHIKYSNQGFGRH